MYNDPNAPGPLDVMIKRLNFSIQGLHDIVANISEPTPCTTIHAEDLDQCSQEVEKVIKQLIDHQKQQQMSKDAEKGIFIEVGQALKIVAKYATPALENILAVGVQGSAVKLHHILLTFLSDSHLESLWTCV